MAFTLPSLANNNLLFSSKRTLKPVLQSEASECGLACLTMIANYYGNQANLSANRRHYEMSSQGANLKQLMQIATTMDFSSRALKLSLKQLSQLTTPCILHWNLNHFVVLKSVKGNKVTICDPAIGQRQLTISEVDKSFTGVALELTQLTTFKETKPTQTLLFSDFWRGVIGLKRNLAIIFALSLLLQIFAIASPFYMQTVIDDVIVKTDHELLLVLAFGFGLLLIIDVFTNTLRQLVILAFSNYFNLQMASNVFHHLLRLPTAFFLKRHMGDIVSRFSSLQHIRELLTTGIVASVLDGLLAIVTLVVMFFYSAKLAFIVLSVVCIYALVRYLFFVPIRKLTQEQLIKSAKENSHFMETMRAVQTIKLNEKEVDRQSQWQNHLTGSMNKNIQLANWNISFEVVNKLLFGLENIIIISFAALAVIDSIMSIGMIYAFISYKNRFIGSMDGLIGKLIEFKMLDIHLSRLADIVLTPQEKPMHSSLAPPISVKDIRGQITLKSLSFSYSKVDQLIFDSISIDLQAAKTIAVIGQSGCGKTTLIQCMLGILKPSEGQVLIDGIDINDFSHFKKLVGAVLQDDHLLTGSIAENITCFTDDVTQEQVVNAAMKANIHHDIMHMNMQYNTHIGDMGDSLSGGQKQRILLARALCKDPKILFLDEATSHLDILNEQTINQHIKNLSITRIIIAHRPQTIANADQILELKNGKLVDVTATFLTHYNAN